MTHLRASPTGPQPHRRTLGTWKAITTGIDQHDGAPNVLHSVHRKGFARSLACMKPICRGRNTSSVAGPMQNMPVRFPSVDGPTLKPSCEISNAVDKEVP